MEFGDSDLGEGLISKQRHFRTAREAYDNGYRLVTEKIKKAHEIYNELSADFKGYGSHAYYDTVVKGIPEFFKWYDPRLNPLNHIILIDYTVLEPLHELEGVDLIYRWLVCVRMEQRFLSKLSHAYIRDVLIRYHTDYEELFFNICSALLKKLLVNMLISARPEKIIYDEPDYRRIAEVVSNTKKEELEGELLNHLEKLITNIYQGDLELYRYLAIEIPNIATELKNATKNNTLYHL